jgi:peptide/nickel transport system substrate-binding protein
LKIRKIGIFIAMLTFVLVLFGCSGEANQTSDDGEGEETGGGELQYAINTQPPSIDPHMSTATATRDVARHIFESLVTLNSKYEVVPMLAKSWEQSEDGKTYTFQLREGVKFHNGEEMTAEDVVASMSRWKERSATAQTLLEGATFEAKDDYTVVLQVEKPSVFVLPALAGTLQFAGIMPKEVVEATTETGVKEYIGTAPFKFVEWKQDQHIHLAKFEDYQPLDTPADGLGGKKEALVDDLYIQIVTDPSTRLTGLQTGQYDVGYGYEQDMLEQLESDPGINVFSPMIGYTSIVLNKTKGLFSDIKMRQAVNAALDVGKIAKASLVNNYRLNSSYMQEEQANWYSEAGSELYNSPDPEKAKRLLEEAGYNGETIRLITSRDYSYMYNSAAVIKEQLAKVGVNVELEVYDWPTVVSKRADPELWEIFITGLPTTSTPVEQLFFNSSWVDGPPDEKIEGLLQELRTSTSHEEAKKVWDELQGYSWEFLPIIKIADYTRLSASTEKVKGVTFFDGPVLWNTKVVE